MRSRALYGHRRACVHLLRQSMMQAVAAVPAIATGIVQTAFPRIWGIATASVAALASCHISFHVGCPRLATALRPAVK